MIHEKPLPIEQTIGFERSESIFNEMNRLWNSCKTKKERSNFINDCAKSSGENLNREIQNTLLKIATGEHVDWDGIYKYVETTKKPDLKLVWLLTNGLTADTSNTQCSDVLIESAQKGFVDVVRFLLKTGPPSYREVRQHFSSSALHRAALNNCVETVKVLLEGAHHSYREILDDVNCTALHNAAQAGHVEVVRLLLQGPNTQYREWQDDYGVTALNMASREGHVEVVKELLKGANPGYLDISDFYDGTPFENAAFCGHE
eukprot:TRINITY_DN3996_c0_g2_i1.p1 TRINITY_DN3996_c0_g2~~TRINITY_DN3996_c0_g2_i1.p1  ORF type:complete len:260 (+),score=55.96 TRINITY_DN3996_c0_g2_i1:133-912(+)